MTLVAGAVAGDDLATVAATAAAFLACPVAIVIPALGDPVVAPAEALDEAAAAQLVETARRAVAGAPPGGEAVVVRIAEQVVGIVAGVNPGTRPDGAERRAWLEAAAAAASVTALIREAHGGTVPGAEDEDLLAELLGGGPADLLAFLSRARHAGHELGSGAVAIAARRAASSTADTIGELRTVAPVLIAHRGRERLLALVPIEGESPSPAVEALLATLADHGWDAVASTPRRLPADLPDAVAEAELLCELRAGKAAVAGREETHRLLIGVLLRDRDAVHELCLQTITPLADYDARHETDLLATLQTFLRHDGSTTETAEAMQLHRHTVGYRLSRVHEVSGLSPYESDGRERLSLGIKAAQILEAERRRGRVT